MKKSIKLFVSLLLVFLLAMPAGLANAFRPEQWMDKSPLYTADQLVYTGAGYFYGIVVHTDGTNSVTVKIYDNTSAAGSARILGDWVVSTSSSNRAQSFGGDTAIIVNTGIYVDITTSGTATFQVFYRSK